MPQNMSRLSRISRIVHQYQAHSLETQELFLVNMNFHPF